ncbi:kinetochore component CENP-S-domain-containing protein [Phlyctochytrium arcticum]|nr:kinetochore component CENP-S-domain-containing protein [Phlyctochytrium arcticum]
MTEDDPVEDELKQRLRAAMHYATNKICDSSVLESELQVMASPHFLHALSEIVHSQAESLALDVEAFSKHARRTTINSDDLLLCARKNASLKAILVEAQKACKREAAKGKKRRSATG